MKRLILAIAALGFIFANTPAMAAGPKPPTALCLDFIGFSDFHQLVIKSMGTVRSSGGVAKMYNITGHAGPGLSEYPISGSGYVVPGTTTFHAAYSGNGRSGGNVHFNWEVVFDLGASSGSVFALFQGANSFTGGPLSVVATDCASLPIVAAPAREGVKSVGQE